MGEGGGSTLAACQCPIRHALAQEAAECGSMAMPPLLTRVSNVLASQMPRACLSHPMLGPREGLRVRACVQRAGWARRGAARRGRGLPLPRAEGLRG